MPIPIDPKLIFNAFNAPPVGVATSLFTCAPAQEGLKTVAIQLQPGDSGAILVDLSIGSPNPPISQMAMAFIDATQSGSDVSILFPDTGYTVRIAGGDAALVPVFTAQRLPKFYIIFGNNDPNVYSENDIANIFAVNQFIPEFNTQNFIKSLSLGIIPQFDLIDTFGPPLTQSLSFSQQFDATDFIGGFLFDATIIGGLQISALIQSSMPQIYNLSVVGETSNTVYFSWAFAGTTDLQRIDICSLTGMGVLLLGGVNPSHTAGNETLDLVLDTVDNLQVGLFNVTTQADNT